MANFTFKSVLTYLIKALLAGGLIFYMVDKGNLDFSKLFNDLPITVILWGGFVVFFSIFANTVRWNMLLKSQNLASSVLECLKITLIGLFFNFFFPSAIGGDVMRSFYIARDNKEQKVKAVFSVVADRILGMTSMVSLAMLTMIFYSTLVFSNDQLTKIFYSASLVSLGVIAFIVVSLSKGVKNKLSQIQFLKKLPLKEKFIPFYDALHSYGDKKKTLVVAYLLSFISQLGMIYFVFLVGEQISDVALPIGTYFFAVPVGLIIIALPISPAGIGVGQLAFAYLFNVFSGVETDVGQLGITAYQMNLLFWGLWGAVFYIQRKAPKKALSEQVTA